MNTTILVCRHGEVDNPQDLIYHRALDVKLSEKGRQQMRYVGESLKKLGFTPSVIYTSPLTRTKESTQEIVRSFKGVSIIVDDGLLEVNSPGLEKKTITWITKAHEEGYNEYEDSLYKDSIEAPGAIATRMKRALSRIIQKHKGKTVIVVSHGDPIAFLKMALLHPDISLTGYEDFKHIEFPEKGEVWEVIFDENARLITQRVLKIMPVPLET